MKYIRIFYAIEVPILLIRYIPMDSTLYSISDVSTLTNYSERSIYLKARKMGKRSEKVGDRKKGIWFTKDELNALKEDRRAHRGIGRPKGSITVGNVDIEDFKIVRSGEIRYIATWATPSKYSRTKAMRSWLRTRLAKLLKLKQ